MKVRPYIVFSPHRPKRSTTAPVSSERSGIARPCLSRKRSWLFTLSLEMATTAVSAAANAGSAAVKSSASVVHPGVSSFG